MVRRPVVWTLSVGLVAMSAGCHDGSSRSLLNPPAAAQPKMSLTTTEAIRKHNENAELVQALQARPQIVVSSPGLNAKVDGRMALERPKNFKLEMRTMGTKTVADIGSNDDEFWFWTASQNRRENAVYVCSYDDIERTPLSAAFQPDWITEAMGLRSISPDEARRMKTEPGDAYGTIKLISTRRGAGGETLTKVTIIDPSGNVKEHQLHQGKTRIASAVIESYQRLPGPDGKESVTLPKKFKLEWVPEKLALDIVLESPKILPTYTADQRRDIFTEPEIPGSKRLNLADYAAPAAPASSPRRASFDDDLPALPTPKTRSSRPAPPTGTGVQLEAPESAGGEVSPRASRGPISLSADLDPVGPARVLDQVVRPSLPRAVEP